MSQPYEEKQTGFSDLPQEVICEILGYLDIEDLARSNTLSKDLNKWCTLVPRLHINRPNMNGEENTNKRDNFFEFLKGYSQKVFEQKRLRYIKLCWDFSLCVDEEEDHVEAWLSRAARDTNVKLTSAVQVHTDPLWCHLVSSSAVNPWIGLHSRSTEALSTLAMLSLSMPSAS